MPCGYVDTHFYWTRGQKLPDGKTVKNLWPIEGKGTVRPFTESREIRKGYHKGKVEVTIRNGRSRKIIVKKSAIRRFPDGD